LITEETDNNKKQVLRMSLDRRAGHNMVEMIDMKLLIMRGTITKEEEGEEEEEEEEIGATLEMRIH